MLMARENLDHDFAGTTQLADSVGQGSILPPGSPHGARGFRRRQPACQLAQIQAETRGGTGTAKCATDVIVAAAADQGVVPTLGVQRKRDARVITITPDVAQVDTDR